MDMPTQCSKCQDVVEFNHMTNIGQAFYCEECTFKIEDEEMEDA